MVSINDKQTDLLGCGLLVLPEEVVEDGAVLLVDPLHLVYVLSNLKARKEGNLSWKASCLVGRISHSGAFEITIKGHASIA